METIYHITRSEQWIQSSPTGSYSGDTLATEGFIHCSTLQQVVRTANAFFHGQPGLILLCIDSSKVEPAIKYEDAGNGELFPHIYGPLNIEAVSEVLPFEPGPDGFFALPPKLQLKVKAPIT
jgi:uncharacterized protein (DUF952 family)